MTAVAPVVISGNGVWVGWPGMHMDNPKEPIPESDPNDRTPTAGLLSRKVCFFFPPDIFSLQIFRFSLIDFAFKWSIRPEEIRNLKM